MEFELIDACSDICNLTIPGWCSNFLFGLNFSHCITESCVQDLCGAALVCEENYENIISEDFCPTVFDGWSCVNATPSGEKAVFPCPKFEHLNFDPEKTAYRQCGPNGSWYDEENKRAYTHYIDCVDEWAGQWYEIINQVYVSGYTISLAFLLVAILILLFFRSLRCVRNAIHLHLFVASFLYNLTYLIWYYGIIRRFSDVAKFKDEEDIACKFLNSLQNYFMVATYTWMLCEGLYLFTVLIVTYVSEKRVLVALHFIGWGLPAILIPVYAVARALFNETEEQLCWMEDGAFNWIYKTPCIVSIFVNVFFLVWIVYILVRKIHSHVSDVAALVKTARAICVLIPLFGLHNFLSAFKPDGSPNSGPRIASELLQAVTVSFQGMVVAILFCLTNNEVIAALKKFFTDQLNSLHPHPIAMSQYTMRNLEAKQSTEENVKLGHDGFWSPGVTLNPQLGETLPLTIGSNNHALPEVSEVSRIPVTSSISVATTIPAVASIPVTSIVPLVPSNLDGPLVQI